MQYYKNKCYIYVYYHFLKSILLSLSFYYIQEKNQHSSTSIAVKMLNISEMLLFWEKYIKYIRYGFRPEMAPHLVVNIKMPCTHFI